MSPPFYCALFKVIKMKLSEMFIKELEYIKNPALKEITINVLDSSPECIKTIPASASGKYHPSYSLGEGGLVRHIKAAVGIAHSMIETDIFPNIVCGNDCFNKMKNDTDFIKSLEIRKDCAYVALILHDSIKAFDNDPKHKTVFEHPLIAARMFKSKVKEYVVNNKDRLSGYDKVVIKFSVILIYDAIASHMGQWNTARYAKGVVLPVPETGLENFVHLCDYLASRKYLIFDFDVYNEVDR